MWWWARSYTRRVTGEEATAQARQQLSLMLAGLAGIGVLSAAISEVLARCRPRRKPLAGYQFDEITVARRPGASSERYLAVMVAVKISSLRAATAARRSVHTGWTEPSMAAMPS
jgi:hypothetical protein